MIKTKIISFIVVLFTLLLSSCNEDKATVVDNVESHFQYLGENNSTRSCISDSILPLKENDSLKYLKELVAVGKNRRTKILPAETIDDDFFAENMYAVRELPLTIKVRNVADGNNSANCYFACDGPGKEVTLGNSSTDVSNYFYIKILPASSGIPYLLYSNKAVTPLCVGYYTSNPDTKILMSAKDNNGSLFGSSWNLIAANTPGYFVIQSNDYLAQDDSNNWMSIFYYVLEASNGNTIRYAKRIKDKAQQEFLLSPLASFTLSNITFDLEKGSVTNATDLVVKKDYTNDEDYETPISIDLVGKGMETSLFVEQREPLNLNIAKPTSYKIRRPQAVANKVVLLEDENPLVQYSTTTQSIQKQINYKAVVEMKANSLLRLTTRFKRFNISVPFVLTAIYKDRTFKIRGVWKGTTIADPKKNPPVLETKFYDLETGDLL